MTVDRHIRIIRRTNKKDLHKFYNNYLTTGLVHPAQWFGNAMKWYQIHTFNNPYNVGSPNAELALLLNNRKKIQPYLKNLTGFLGRR
jgi:hypothetical protein